MIVCIRTVVIPDQVQDRYLNWIDQGPGHPTSLRSAG
jgi:hypothetical protein